MERICYRDCLTPVRAFYLDLCPVGARGPRAVGAVGRRPARSGRKRSSQRKVKRHRKARMDARTRERLPVLPVLVADRRPRRSDAAAVLRAARDTPSPGQPFTAAGRTLTRLIATAGRDWSGPMTPRTGSRRDLGHEEEHAFWAWAAVKSCGSPGSGSRNCWRSAITA